MTDIDIAAELTLRIVRAVQDYRAPVRRMEGWFFLPDWSTTDWETARARLSAAPKPLVVAPFVEHGFLATWSVGEIPAAERAGAEGNQRNQVEFTEGKLKRLGLGEGDHLTFGTPDAELRISVLEYKRWVREYAVLAAVGIMKRKSPGLGAITIFVPGGGIERPIGLPDDVDHDAGHGHQH